MSAEIRKKIALNYGLVLGAALLIINVLQYALIDGYNMAVQQSGSIALAIGSFALTIGFPIFAVLKARKEQDGFISFGEAFKLVFTTIIYSAIIGVIWILLYTLVLDPNYQEAAKEAMIEQFYDQNPNMTDEQAEMGIGMALKFTTPLMLSLFGIVASAFMGVIIGLIEAAILKKNKPEFS